MKTDKRRYSSKRFKELVRYLIAKLDTGEGVDEAKLCWALFKCDMESYASTGKSLTGATYIKGETHPIPSHL